MYPSTVPPLRSARPPSVQVSSPRAARKPPSPPQRKNRPMARRKGQSEIWGVPPPPPPPVLRQVPGRKWRALFVQTAPSRPERVAGSPFSAISPGTTFFSFCSLSPPPPGKTKHLSSIPLKCRSACKTGIFFFRRLGEYPCLSPPPFPRKKRDAPLTWFFCAELVNQRIEGAISSPPLPHCSETR